MVTVVGATMPTGGVTIGATPPAQHVPQEAGQPPAQTPATTATPKRSGENRRVSVCYHILARRELSSTARYALDLSPFILRKLEFRNDMRNYGRKEMGKDRD
jgi:hypothetical protein